MDDKMTQLKFIPNDIRVIKRNKRGGNGFGGLKIYCNLHYYIYMSLLRAILGDCRIHLE